MDDKNTQVIFEEMVEDWTAFAIEHEKYSDKGNKSAGSRARKALGALKGLVPAYRKASITESKG